MVSVMLFMLWLSPSRNVHKTRNGFSILKRERRKRPNFDSQAKTGVHVEGDNFQSSARLSSFKRLSSRIRVSRDGSMISYVRGSMRNENCIHYLTRPVRFSRVLPSFFFHPSPPPTTTDPTPRRDNFGRQSLILYCF